LWRPAVVSPRPLGAYCFAARNAPARCERARVARHRLQQKEPARLLLQSVPIPQRFAPADEWERLARLSASRYADVRQTRHGVDLPRHAPHAHYVRVLSSSPFCLLLPLKLFVFVTGEFGFAQHAVNHGQREQRRECGDDQSANHSAPERRVLLAALTETE